MAKRITQETFDAVVKENIDDFEMDEEEAMEDAVKQFESQVGLHVHPITWSYFSPLFWSHYEIYGQCTVIE
jgi:hypothetical protein